MAARAGNWVFSDGFQRGRLESNRLPLRGDGPQPWWLGGGSLARPVLDGRLKRTLGLEHCRDDLSCAAGLEPRGYPRRTPQC